MQDRRSRPSRESRQPRPSFRSRPSVPSPPSSRPRPAASSQSPLKPRGQRARSPRVRRRLRGSGLPRLIQRFRLPLALLLGLGAAGAAVLTGAEGQVETTAALRVSSDIGAGERLSATVIEEVQVDVAAVPRDYAARPEEVLGRQVAVPLPAGALIHPDQLVGPGLLAGQEPGTVAVPVRPADPAMVGMLTPGQRVDVLASSDTLERGSSSASVATAAPVLWTPQDDSENWLPSGAEAGGVVILAVDPATAEAIAQATQEGRLHLSLRGAGEPPATSEPEDPPAAESAGGAR
ncbi:Flp pilus assembly protein CpaB [Nesterenkonia sandarakina]|uniref:Flp pilus assembly protein CpaB n=1 Tax=Nesterenkonia sandarakina TaxID=272918 RepID=A0A2T0YRL4_9MICC|nr:Flp pilus assembly protein CpaB [Nesterenkonia sandarakina]PRZ18203.1 Flp pilus assembly protein CpaB [Nesterenkonia sandarakina]